MSIAIGIAAMLLVVVVVLGLLVVKLAQRYDEVEKERDHLQNVLEGSGVIYSEIYDEDLLEAKFDHLLDKEAEDDEELPGHGLRWDDSQSY